MVDFKNAANSSGLYYPRNRAERRALAKKMKVNNKKMNDMLKPVVEAVNITYLPNGEKVKLKKDKILENNRYKSEEFFEFLNKYDDKELTVERDPNIPDDFRMVTIAEQGGEISKRWAFDYDELELIVDEI